MKFRLPINEHTMALVRPVLPFFLGALVVLNLQDHHWVLTGLTVVVWMLNIYTSMRLDRSVHSLLGVLTTAHRIHLEAISSLVGALRAALGMSGAE